MLVGSILAIIIATLVISVAVSRRKKPRPEAIRQSIIDAARQRAVLERDHQKA
jgi:hypothetical protein